MEFWQLHFDRSFYVLKGDCLCDWKLSGPFAVTWESWERSRDLPRLSSRDRGGMNSSDTASTLALSASDGVEGGDIWFEHQLSCHLLGGELSVGARMAGEGKGRRPSILLHTVVAFWAACLLLSVFYGFDVVAPTWPLIRNLCPSPNLVHQRPERYDRTFQPKPSWWPSDHAPLLQRNASLSLRGWSSLQPPTAYTQTGRLTLSLSQPE